MRCMSPPNPLTLIALAAAVAACGSRPEPTPTAGAAATPSPATSDGAGGADVAIVSTPEGLFAVATDGSPPKPLRAPPGTVNRCEADARAGGVWVGIEGTGSDAGALYFVDLERPGPAIPVLRGLPAGMEELIIDHGDAGRIGGHDPVTMQVGLAIRMGETPAVEPEIGCEGDGAWTCYLADDVATEGAPLLPEYEAQRAAIAALTLVDGAWLAGIARRGRDRPLWKASPGGAAAALPKVAAVPVDGCRAMPEACGEARSVPGTALWRVVVSNDEGDFYAQEEQLYDPVAAVFFDPTAPAARSPTPLAESASIEGMLISPSGAGFANWGGIYRFDGQPVSLPADASVCGWTRPATRLGGPRG